MKIGDKVQVVDTPISLLKQHANIKGTLVKKGLDNKWLVEFGWQQWWAKEYDLEVVDDDEEFGNICKNLLPFRIRQVFR